MSVFRCQLRRCTEPQKGPVDVISVHQVSKLLLETGTFGTSQEGGGPASCTQADANFIDRKNYGKVEGQTTSTRGMAKFLK